MKLDTNDTKVRVYSDQGVTKERVPKKSKKVWLWILAVIVTIMIIGSTAEPETEDNKATQSPASSETVSESQKPSYDKSDIAKVCQEFINNHNLLNSAGFNQKNVALIDIWDYKDELTENASKTREGEMLHIFQWNGKNKINDDRIRFSCWLTIDGTNASVRYMSAAGTPLYGTLDL